MENEEGNFIFLNQNHCSLHGYYVGDENTPCPRCTVIAKRTTPHYELKVFAWQEFQQYLATTTDDIISFTMVRNDYTVLVRKP